MIPKAAHLSFLQQVVRLIHHALDQDLNYFDTINIYRADSRKAVPGKSLRGQSDKVKNTRQTYQFPTILSSAFVVGPSSFQLYCLA
ncbi:MAG: hypothetical protein ABSB84_02340 [Verrucomicrobiota bacterium]